MMKKLELSMKAKLDGMKEKVALAREHIDLTINRTSGSLIADIPQSSTKKEDENILS